jgi:cytochrome c-type biogenesis protein CcmH
MIRALAIALLVSASSASAAPQGIAPIAPPRPPMTAADSLLEERTKAVAATLRCPVCQGESIQDSPSTLAQQMRAVVKERLRSGETPEQVKAYFVARYGEWILLEPKMTGLNLVLYALPVVLIIGGLAFVVFLVRKWTRPVEAGE